MEKPCLYIARYNNETHIYKIAHAFLSTFGLHYIHSRNLDIYKFSLLGMSFLLLERRYKNCGKTRKKQINTKKTGGCLVIKKNS